MDYQWILIGIKRYSYITKYNEWYFNGLLLKIDHL